MELLLIIPLLLLSAFYSGSETGLYSMSRVRLEYLSEHGQRRARALKKLYTPLAPTIITILICNNFVAEMLARLTEQSLTFLGPWSVLAATLILTPILLIVGEFLPKWWARKHADHIMYQVAYVLMASRIVLTLPVMVCRWIASTLQWLIPGQHREIWEPHASRPNLRTFIRSPENKQVISDVQQRLVDRILALERLTLAYEKITKPLAVVFTLPANDSIKQALGKLGPKYFQRYLLRYPGARLPHAWVSAQALLSADESTPISEISHPLPRLPDSTPLPTALQHMQAEGAEMVLVTDYSGTPKAIAFRGDCLRVLMQLTGNSPAA